ncbi:ABC transporter permease [candidate division KSB1 bacterium]
MFKNYIKLIFRNFLKYKSFSLINVSSLVLGFTCCMFILIYVIYEKSYDKYHENSERIYRVTAKFQDVNRGYSPHFARCFLTWIHTLPNEFPEIEEIVRFAHEMRVVKKNNIKFYEQNFYRVDANVFNVFSFKLLRGDPNTSLARPFTMVITESMAKKYFKDEDPLGQKLSTTARRNNEQVEYEITGIMQDIPRSSHIDIDFLASYIDPLNAGSWYYTYILLKPGTDVPALEKKFPEVIDKNQGPGTSQTISIPLQKLTDIHLRSNLNRELKPNGSLLYVNISSLVAVLILLTACINFINLSSARSTHRSKEIGIRKVLGASKKQLIKYFLGESVLNSLIALFLSYLLLIFLFPLFNNIVNPDISLKANRMLLSSFIIIAVFSGLLSGWYPAFLLSSFQPNRVLKAGYSFKSIRSGTIFSPRRILVIIQFFISISLIIYIFIISSQMFYIRNKDLGFKTEDIIAIDNIPDIVREKYSTFKTELLTSDLITDVSAVMDRPSKEVLDAGPFQAEGVIQDPDNPKLLFVLPVDENIIEIMNMDLISGKGFLPGSFKDTAKTTYILNESAAKFIGWENTEEAIGKRFRVQLSVPPQFQPKQGQIVGVVKDFNYADLHKKIKPLVLFPSPRFIFCLLIKVKEDQFESAVGQIRNTWAKIFPDYPFDYQMVDNLYNDLYTGEEKQQKVFGIFTFLAIFIACLGLFGLSVFMLEKRKKEIGIRKTFGASVFNIVNIISKEFILLVAVSNVFAWPAAYYAANRWLQNFAYRTDIGLFTFIISTILSLAIALLTVSFHTVKAAVVNPVEVLRDE